MMLDAAVQLLRQQPDKHYLCWPNDLYAGVSVCCENENYLFLDFFVCVFDTDVGSFSAKPHVIWRGEGREIRETNEFHGEQLHIEKKRKKTCWK